MSVLIKGVEMPTSCGECKAFVCYRQWAGDSGDCFCGITKSDAKVGARNADCPLVPVPPHGRLIDADAFTKDECNNCDGACEAVPCDCLNCEADCRCDFMKDIADAPTIIPAEEGE